MRSLAGLYRSIQRQSWIAAVLAFSILWAAMAFALHTHKDGLAGADVDCQECLFAALSNSPVPDASCNLHPVHVLASSVAAFYANNYVSNRIVVQHARGPPPVSVQI